MTMSLLAVFPLYWMFISATNTSNDVAGGRLLPGAALMDNLRDVMARIDMVRCLWNSFRIAILTTFLSLLFSSLAGYAFEIYHDRKKDRVMGLVLCGMMIPSVATMVPLFKMIGNLNLTNTIWACILPSMTSIMIIFLFRQGSRNFPREVIDAARVDGLSEMGIFVRVFFPMMRSTYSTAFILIFMGSWNNYMWPRLVLKKNGLETMPMLINSLIVGYTPNYGAVLLGCSMCTLPMLVIFLCMQESFENGITGSIKG